MLLLQGIIIAIIGAYLGAIADRFAYWFHVSRAMIWNKHCAKCFSFQAWLTFLPIIGFVARRGMCVVCNERLPVAPFLAEIAGVGLFSGAWFLIWGTTIPATIGIVHAILVAFIVCGMLVLAISDFVYDEVPFFVFIATLAAVIARLLFFTDMDTALNGLIASITAGAIMALLVVMSQWRWVQVHDILFGILIGMIVGWPAFFVTLAFAYVFAVIGGIISWGWNLKMWKGVSSYGLYLFIALAVQGLIRIITLLA